MNDMTFSYSTDHFQEDFIVSVLEVSNFLNIPDGKEWAMKELPGLVTFSPLLQLELAQKYYIDQWIELAFQSERNAGTSSSQVLHSSPKALSQQGFTPGG
jgi:hypothetical protein